MRGHLMLLAAAAFVVWQLLPVARAPAPATWALAGAGLWAADVLLSAPVVRPRGGGANGAGAGGPAAAPRRGGGEQLLALWGFGSALALLSFLSSDPGFQV